MCAQRRLRSAWASAQPDQNLRCPHEESLGPCYPLSAQRRLWSESSLGAYIILLVLSWDGSYVLQSNLPSACPLRTDRQTEELFSDIFTIEPCHEIMELFVLRKLILQTRMRSHPVVLDIWFLVGPFVYFHTSCVRTAKALARLCGCTGSPKPSLVAYVISTTISWAGSVIIISLVNLFCLLAYCRETNFYWIISDYTTSKWQRNPNNGLRNQNDDFTTSNSIFRPSSSPFEVNQLFVGYIYDYWTHGLV